MKVKVRDMDYKNKFINLKKEELTYIDDIANLSSNKTITEEEKLAIYRNLYNYQIKINDILNELKEIFFTKDINIEDLDKVILEIDISKNYLVQVGTPEYRDIILKDYLGIDLTTYKYQLTLSNLIYKKYVMINPDLILTNQRLITNNVYIFIGYHDYSEEINGPCLENSNNYLYGIFENMSSNVREEIPEKEMPNFVKDKMVIYTSDNVNDMEIRKIFNEELLNKANKSLNECVQAVINRTKELDYQRSRVYKEKALLAKIEELYKKVKGENIDQKVLFKGKFLSVISETYKLPNDKIVKKEKTVKNQGKNAVVVIAKTIDNKYLITFQNRITDKIIAEFVSGYIENDETPLEAAQRELLEETGYTTDDLYIIDEANTSPGIDNSLTYMVIAKNSYKLKEVESFSTELVTYDLFRASELDYLIENHIMNGALNKLAYYSLIKSQENNNKRIIALR